MTDATAPSQKCERCGGPHALGPSCPHVKAVEWDPTYFRITRLEFLTPIDYPRQSGVPAEPVGGDGYPRLGRRNG